MVQKERLTSKVGFRVQIAVPVHGEGSSSSSSHGVKYAKFHQLNIIYYLSYEIVSSYWLFPRCE